MSDYSDTFTRHDAKADTADIPPVAPKSGATAKKEERDRRALSYRARQQQDMGGYEMYDTFDSDEPYDTYRTAKKRQYAADAYPSQQTTAKTPKKTKKKKAKHSVAYRVACAVLGTLIGLIVVFSGAAALYIHSLDYERVEINHRNSQENQPTEYVETDDGPEIRTLVPIYAQEEHSSFKDAIRNWKNAGTAYLQSSKVINILLAGIDRNDDGSDGRSDTMIIASINLNTKIITLSSVYRDCWMYETFDGGERSAWAKLNAAFVYGGAEGLVSNIEDYFKIHIDHFVGVDFQSFQEIVDTIGGISVPVKDYEAAYINEQTGYTQVQPGESVKLDGVEALWYVRMRHTDADEEISRTRRQRQFITALIDEFKSTSITELSGVVNKFINYVQTDMKKSEIISYGTKAITQRWYNFEIRQQQVPDDPYRLDYLGSVWVWLVDYPGAAYAMQKEIYGYSNIELDEDRYTMIDLARALIQSGYQLV